MIFLKGLAVMLTLGVLTILISLRAGATLEWGVIIPELKEGGLLLLKIMAVLLPVGMWGLFGNPERDIERGSQFVMKILLNVMKWLLIGVVLVIVIIVTWNAQPMTASTGIIILLIMIVASLNK